MKWAARIVWVLCLANGGAVAGQEIAREGVRALEVGGRTLVTQDEHPELNGPIFSVDSFQAGLLLVEGMTRVLHWRVDGELREVTNSDNLRLRAVRHVRIDGHGRPWVFDPASRKAVILTSSGTIAGEVRMDRSLMYDAAFAPDGSLLVNGPGTTPATIGHLVHRWNGVSRTWESHLPILADSSFHIGEHEKWAFVLATDSIGRVIAVRANDHQIYMLDFLRGLEVVAEWQYRPPEWPTEDNQARIARDRAAPPASVADVALDPSGRLWVLSTFPQEDWEDAVLRGESDDPEVDFTVRNQHDWHDSLVEVIDLERGRVLYSGVVDMAAYLLAGPGRILVNSGRGEPLSMTLLSLVGSDGDPSVSRIFGERGK